MRYLIALSPYCCVGLDWERSHTNSPPNQPNQLRTEWTHMVGHCLSYALYLVVNKCLFPLTSYLTERVSTLLVVDWSNNIIDFDMITGNFINNTISIILSVYSLHLNSISNFVLLCCDKAYDELESSWALWSGHVFLCKWFRLHNTLHSYNTLHSKRIQRWLSGHLSCLVTTRVDYTIMREFSSISATLQSSIVDCWPSIVSIYGVVGSLVEVVLLGSTNYGHNNRDTPVVQWLDKHPRPRWLMSGFTLSD